MKKIIALLVVTLAFSLTATAQQKKATAKKAVVKKELTSEQKIEQAARKDLNSLTAIVTSLNQTQKDDFYSLFESKHKWLSEDISNDRKAEISKTIHAKIHAGLSPADIEKLERNPTVVRQLTH